LRACLRRFLPGRARGTQACTLIETRLRFASFYWKRGHRRPCVRAGRRACRPRTRVRLSRKCTVTLTMQCPVSCFRRSDVARSRWLQSFPRSCFCDRDRLRLINARRARYEWTLARASRARALRSLPASAFLQGPIAFTAAGFCGVSSFDAGDSFFHFPFHRARQTSIPTDKSFVVTRRWFPSSARQQVKRLVPYLSCGHLALFTWQRATTCISYISSKCCSAPIMWNPVLYYRSCCCDISCMGLCCDPYHVTVCNKN